MKDYNGLAAVINLLIPFRVWAQNAIENMHILCVKLCLRTTYYYLFEVLHFKS